MRDRWHIVTCVKRGEGDELRQWLRENVGLPYNDWTTWLSSVWTNGSASEGDKIGVTVFNETHRILVALRWS